MFYVGTIYFIDIHRNYDINQPAREYSKVLIRLLVQRSSEEKDIIDKFIAPAQKNRGREPTKEQSPQLGYQAWLLRDGQTGEFRLEATSSKPRFCSQ